MADPMEGAAEKAPPLSTANSSRSMGRANYAGLLALGVLVVFVMWGGDVLRWVRTVPEPVRKTVGPLPEVFRNMAFLPQPRRQAAPDFDVQGLDGQGHTLKMHAGKVLLINFWATWCPPCLREMPSMQRLYDKYRSRGFDLLAVSVDQKGVVGVRKFVANLKLSFPILMDPEQRVKQAYRVRALPTNYLLDRRGRVIAWGMGAREWNSEAAHRLIEHLLAEKN